MKEVFFAVDKAYYKSLDPDSVIVAYQKGLEKYVGFVSKDNKGYYNISLGTSGGFSDINSNFKNLHLFLEYASKYYTFKVIN